MRILLPIVLIAAVSVAAAEPQPARSVIQSVAVSSTSFNPSSGESVRVSIVLAKAGRMDAVIVDRDGYPTRMLMFGRLFAAGRGELIWDGRGDDGHIVADEAYSLRLQWTDGKTTESYFPANRPAQMTAVVPRYYSRSTATLVYELPVPSRVHVQAGTAALNPKTKKLEGPVLKTIVNREPRAAGRIAEYWNGFDESREIYVPDLQNFVTAIATTPLPENSIIAFGNHTITFLDYATARKGTSRFTFRVRSHMHHAGLSALDDVSPPMKLEPLNAVWSEAERIWTTSDAVLKVRIGVEGLAAERFMAQPGKLYQFINGKQITLAPSARESMIVEIPMRQFPQSLNTLSINWQSLYGAVAASSLRVRAAPAPAMAGAAR